MKTAEIKYKLMVVYWVGVLAFAGIKVPFVDLWTLLTEVFMEFKLLVTRHEHKWRWFANRTVLKDYKRYTAANAALYKCRCGKEKHSFRQIRDGFNHEYQPRVVIITKGYE